MRGEDRLAAHSLVEMLAHRPRDRYAVVRARATTDLVEQHETAGSGGVQDGARFRHLHHEGGLAPDEIVARAHAREHPVADPDRCPGGRPEPAYLRHQPDEPDLPDDLALAGPVPPR